MANVVKHAFVSAKADGADATLVRPLNWNAEHPFVGGVTNGDALVWKSTESDKAIFAPVIPGGTRTIFDQDTAPLGWTRDATVDDRVVKIQGLGARVHGGSWTVSGLTASSHTHTLANHTHSFPHAHGLPLIGVGTYAAGALDALTEPTDTQDSTVTGTPNTNTSGATAPTIASDAVWRPLHRSVILCSKDAY